MEQQVSLLEVLKYFISFGPVVWIGVLSAVITFVVEIRLCQKGILFSSGEKKLKKARELGNIIQATCVSSRYIDDKDNDSITATRQYAAVYQYEVNGEVKKKCIISTGVNPPQILWLYYINSPYKVFSEYDVGTSPFQFLLYIIPILVAFIVMKLLGYGS